MVGVGKIAAAQHVPAMAADPRFTLAATADPRGGLDGIRNFSSLAAMLEACPELDAVILCTPPKGRQALARLALTAGKHVLLEKPPAASPDELEELAGLARRMNVTLFAAWHSRYAASVAASRTWLKGRPVSEVRILWKEDVRVWHPGQDWIWQPEGLGVFDPGINALSILTTLMEEEFSLVGGDLRVPQNRQAPIAASLAFTTAGGVPIRAEFDWRSETGELWEIEIDTADDRHLRLFEGGARLEIDGQPVPGGESGEYQAVYADFARLIAAGLSEADGRPLRHVADAFRLARRIPAAPFLENQD
jgi:predicted dehydrogenase